MKFKQDFFVRTTVIIVAMVFLIAGAKIVRYTIMKEILVDLSIGHGMLGWINNETSIIYDENISEEELGAGEKASIIFILPIKRCIPGGMPLPLEWKMRPSSLRRKGLL